MCMSICIYITWHAEKNGKWNPVTTSRHSCNETRQSPFDRMALDLDGRHRRRTRVLSAESPNSLSLSFDQPRCLDMESTPYLGLTIAFLVHQL
jgi:hypothetical protein